MHLVTFRVEADGKSLPGVLDGDTVLSLDKAGVPDTMLGIVQEGQSAIQRIRAALPSAQRYPRSLVRLEAPIRPGKVLCSGVNYKGHALEMPNAVLPDEPFFFAKLPTSIAGPESPVRRTDATQQMDYEVEFCAVIGKPLYQAREEEIMPALFGYTVMNDLSARDIQFRNSQITLGKNLPAFAPIGPAIVTADTLTDPGHVRLRTRVNGTTMQDGCTSDWLFPLPRLIAWLSGFLPLDPGDIVSTGTPPGVGVFRNPQVFLAPGDIVEVEADGIGVIRTPILA
ncbi:MAG: fumarylacetoacetate hydrolase family protein [Lautropia sp.]|nr:fumarylacetoacetate hydrolase family protein [Lautropia sp.]